MSFEEKNETNEFDFSKEIDFSEEMDTGAIAKSVRSISDQSAGTEEMELYEDDHTRVMDAIPHSAEAGILADLELLPEEEEEQQDDSAEEADPEIPLSRREREELGDLSYHDEDVTPERHREHAHHAANREHRAAGNHEGTSGHHREGVRAASSERRHSAEHKGTPSANASAKRRPSSVSAKGGNSGSRKGAKEDKRKFGWLDLVLIGGGVVVLAVVAILITTALRKSAYNAEIENVAEIGEELASLSGIGQKGIDGIAASRTTATVDSITDDTDAATKEVSVNFSSMEKDLKIKFSDKITDELIAGVLFKVEARTPDNKSVIWSDDDKDGIIYEEDLTPGLYYVKIASVDPYKFPDKETEVTVKEKISYTAINVVNEIKKESEVNVATEDKKTKEVDTGTQLQDTVAWVNSSTKTSYQEVGKDTLVIELAMLSSARSLSADPTPETTSEGTSEPASEATSEPSSEPASEKTSEPASEETSEPASETAKIPVTDVTLSATSLYMTNDGTATVSYTITPQNAKTSTITWTSSNKEIVTVEGGEITSHSKGKATVTCIVVGQDGGSFTKTCEVSVGPYIEKLTVGNKITTIAKGKTQQLSATVTTVGDLDKTVEWKSSDTNRVTVDANGLLTAKEVTESGKTVEITCTTKGYGADGKQLVDKFTLTVTGSSVKNPDAQLKDKSGNDIYVKEGENFRLAKNDDYTKFSNFYIKKTVYTGWQTLNGKTQYYKADGNYVTGEQVIGGVKYNFASDGSLSMGGGSMGIDVSSWNGNIDWNAVKNSGVSFVIIRCGYRGYTLGGLIEDSKFHTYASGAEAAGLKVGVYFFSQAVNEREAVEEASMAISMARSHKISYPIFIDSEYGAASHNGRADKLDKSTRTAVCKAFCETIRSAGYTPGVYASKSWYYNNLDASALNNYKIWLAHYCAQTDYTGKYELWQSSSTGRINGISGNVDIDTSYLGY